MWYIISLDVETCLVALLELSIARGGWNRYWKICSRVQLMLHLWGKSCTFSICVAPSPGLGA